MPMFAAVWLSNADRKRASYSNCDSTTFDVLETLCDVIVHCKTGCSCVRKWLDSEARIQLAQRGLGQRLGGTHRKAHTCELILMHIEVTG